MNGTLNNVLILGIVDSFGEMKYVNNLAISEVSIATYRQKGSVSRGTQTIVTDITPVTAFGTNAELCRDKLKIGDKVFIQGTLQSNSWKDKHGETKNLSRLVAGKIEILKSDSKNKETADNGNKADDFSDDIPF